MLRVVLTAGVLALVGEASIAACSDDSVELQGDWGSARFRVAVADEPAERSQGLMHVETLPRMSGMLFVYERPQRVSFWMENTLIPLDMVFLDETGTVVHVHPNAVPLDRTPIPGQSDAVQYVLEVNGGVAAAFGIAPGTELRHPAIDPDLAVWPCDP